MEPRFASIVRPIGSQSIVGGLPRCLTPRLFHSFFFKCRAIFYSQNPDAAKTKKPALAEDGAAAPLPASSRNFGASSPFPAEGWLSEASLLPVGAATTVLGHLMKTGKLPSGDELTVVQKLLNRGHQFFFGGYVQDVLVCRTNTNRNLSQVSVKSKCWASQKKARITHKK